MLVQLHVWYLCEQGLVHAILRTVPAKRNQEIEGVCVDESWNLVGPWVASDRAWSPSTTGSVGGSCKCCGGAGVQHNSQTGLTVVCPCCGGSGQWNPTGITW